MYKLENIKLIGLLGGMTNNEKEMQGTGVIAKTMNQFISEKLWEKIPNLTNPTELLAVYSKYESDANGNYSYFIGMQVSLLSNIPEGMESLELPAQEYSKYTSESGQMPKVCIDTWQKIWNDKSINRAYTADFEKYYFNKPDMVDIFIAVK